MILRLVVFPKIPYQLDIYSKSRSNFSTYSLVCSNRINHTKTVDLRAISTQRWNVFGICRYRQYDKFTTNKK